MVKIFRLISHIINGTLQRRIHFEKIKKRAIERTQEWNEFYLSPEDNITIDFDNDTSLKLYKDSTLSQDLHKGNFEFHEIKFISSFLQSGDAFIDVGANIGYFSVVASRSVGTGSVHSFEPTKKTYKRLLESIDLNKTKNIYPHKVALSDVKERREFTTSNDGFDAYNSLGVPSQGIDFSKETLTTVTLDAFLKEQNIATPTLIKIDVEGWEIPVIKGMKELLNKKDSPVLMVEFTEDNAKLSGFSCANLFNLISSFNYALYKYNWVTNELVKQENKKFYTYTNLVCIKANSAYFERLISVNIV